MNDEWSFDVLVNTSVDKIFLKFIPHQNLGSTGIDLESLELDNFIFTKGSSI